MSSHPLTSTALGAPRVVKFGGSSLASAENVCACAAWLWAWMKQSPCPLLVVVSAPAGRTDELVRHAEDLMSLSLGSSSIDHSQKRGDRSTKFMDQCAKWKAGLMVQGEHQSQAAMALALEALRFNDATIDDDIGIHTWHVRDIPIHAQPSSYQDTQDLPHASHWLDRGVGAVGAPWDLKKAAFHIIAGFQAWDDEIQQLVCLGRGGSDLSAVAIAASVGAKDCWILSDVDGVYSAHPGQHKDARWIDVVPAPLMHTWSKAGAKVINARGVAMAQAYGITLHLAKSPPFVGREVPFQLPDALAFLGRSTQIVPSIHDGDAYAQVKIVSKIAPKIASKLFVHEGSAPTLNGGVQWTGVACSQPMVWSHWTWDAASYPVSDPVSDSTAWTPWAIWSMIHKAPICAQYVRTASNGAAGFHICLTMDDEQTFHDRASAHGWVMVESVMCTKVSMIGNGFDCERDLGGSPQGIISQALGAVDESKANLLDMNVSVNALALLVDTPSADRLCWLLHQTLIRMNTESQKV